ncbi:MAG: UDP-N-acetylglucosamine 2-epimerase (non-hydrolyzing) [Bacillaceae bacterium]|nr:UDP-N-acetylglucosamine 2-epimerase (non-hydrolyzing) [Bacillaceae bacterium]
MKLAVVVGTRPELIKMAMLIKELKKRNTSNLFIHSGQHYDYHMDGMVLSLFDLPKPDFHLAVGSGTHAYTTSNVMIQVEKLIKSERIDLIIVHGDTNTTLGASLAAAKSFVPIVHIEAGLRSYDKTMPEEINRIIVDHLSTYLMSPTQEAISNLKKEGITSGVYCTGQTIVDAIHYLKNLKPFNVLNKYGLTYKEFYFVTVHRQENTDDVKRLHSIFKSLYILANSEKKVVLSLHPRTKKILTQHDKYDELINSKIVTLDPPPNFFESIQLQHNASFVITDSGGLQEESCILGTPCITLRENTERPETVECGANILAGYKTESILNAIKQMKIKAWKHPYGDVGISSRILDIIAKKQ